MTTFEAWLQSRGGQAALVTANLGTMSGDALKLAFDAALEAAAQVCVKEQKMFLYKEAAYLPQGEPRLTAMAAAASGCAWKIRNLITESHPQNPSEKP